MIRLGVFWCALLTLVFGVSVGTYNVENLFDAKTQGSEYDDYTLGKLGWDEKMAQKKLANTIAVIRALDADILALQEVENEALMESLSKTLSYPYFAFAKPSHVATGVGVLSRYPFEQTEAIPLERGREMLWAKIKIDSEYLELVNVHWPSLRNPRERRLRAAQTLKTFVRGREKVLLLGDFNDPLGYESVLAETFGRLELRQGWFDPWFTQQERWSHDFFGDKKALDRMVLSQGLLNKEGLVYAWGSFERFSQPFFSTKNGSPYRWERRNRGKGAHTGRGYSDHFPLRLKLTTTQMQSSLNPVGLETVFSAKEGKANLFLKDATVVYVHNEGMVLGKEGRGVYVHKPDFEVSLGEVLDVWVHGVKNFQGMREISALHVERVSPKKRDIYAHMLPQSSLKEARPGDVMREVEGVVKQGRLVTSDGAVRLYAKNTSHLPKEGEYVRLERVRVGMYGGQKELILEERK
ncbi:endonuclease/exonuclease/phosphatase family protein [Sulfurospirillum sp. T05]|uniref:Endonuclease/exonuclease/phosphatase family protein n=1 Tax=Sulfurospirillum tamanense TaxID=2813362 RepID=A0ABS2WS29_9BACT|nr:endonuclease/exonuclease/phosphatase family protein [Sulfurospirillum tamanensis]MBN2964427.1 endonuclease/exonuclease/phosphatase family protein [Sulfurospirillum tamanensis]